jgi:hypothetical protein
MKNGGNLVSSLNVMRINVIVEKHLLELMKISKKTLKEIDRSVKVKLKQRSKELYKEKITKGRRVVLKG